MRIVETDHWCLLLSGEWSAESEDGTVCIRDADDVDEIRISTLLQSADALLVGSTKEFAARESPDVTHWCEIKLGSFLGVMGQFIDQDAAVREWYVKSGKLLLYISHVCHIKDVGLDDAAVDELLETLVASGSASVNYS